MVKQMSKFEYGMFYGDYDTFAVSKEKYSLDDAVEIYKNELDARPGEHVAVGTGWVRHRAGVNEDGEPCVSWWLEYEKHNRSCPVWVMHTVYDPAEEQSRYKYNIFRL